MNKIAIEFEDEIHYIVQSSLDVDCYYYDKDSGGNLYCVNNDINKKVIRYNSCGRVVAEFTVPEDVFVETSPGSENQGIAPSYRVESQYYGLSIDSKGNAYANRRTASGYSLVKWPWKDSDKDKNEGPFIPQYIKAKPEAEYVNLVWKLSPQDPGCVTGYRLLRSETPNGETTEIAILGQGVEKTVDGTVEPGKTYYYKIQTLSDIANSEFTPEVSVVIE
jgi:hypothetical protein